MASLPMLAIAGLGLGVAGTIATAQAQRQAGRDQQAAYDLQAAAAERTGLQEEQVARARLAKLLSSQRALYAKAGVDLSTGSPLTVLAATAAEGEREALTIRTGAEEEAEFLRFQGRAARAAGSTQAGATLLSGLGSTATKAFTISQIGK